eukprot:1160172-Pelagomonas_calceolata.AAC.6
MIVIRGCKTSKAVTLLLRGANDYMLDEMDRSLHDSLCVVKRVLESGSVVPGEGCTCPSHIAGWAACVTCMLLGRLHVMLACRWAAEYGCTCP